LKASKLTVAAKGNCIVEVRTGKLVRVGVELVSYEEIKTVHKKDGWVFSWKQEFKNEQHQLYKLVVAGSASIQALLSIEPIKEHEFIEMHLIELAPQNKGPHRRYSGIARHLAAFACKMSIDLGFEGYVVFTSKTKLIEHYKRSLGANVLFGQRMCLFPEAAKNLVNLCYQMP
jgi:hypothetical protein